MELSEGLVDKSQRNKVGLILAIILLVALILRIVAAIYLGNTVSGLSGAHDEISYSMLGQRYADGYGMTFPSPWYPWIQANAPQSYYSFTFSFFLAAIYKAFGYQPLVARLIMATLSTLIVFMIYLISARLFNRQLALVSAAIAAVYAYLIFYGVTLVTETPFILAILVVIYASLRIVHGDHWLWWFVLGFALTVSLLLRMAVIFFIPILFVWLLVQIKERRQWPYFLIPIGLVILAILPFTVRNYRMWNQFLLLESQFGHVFWNGNHPDHQGDFHPYEVFPIPEDVLASNNDAIITNQLLRMGIANVVNDPTHFVILTLGRLREFFTFWPTHDSTLEANLLRVISFGILVPFILIGLIYNLRSWRPLLPIYAFILIHTGIYATSWTMIRYRIPLDALFIIFAAWTFVAIADTWKSRRGEKLLQNQKIGAS